ncbi:HlyD family efflux transporter periplasmic adaptor subunit [Isosphaeraceae bacterium EP7]
MRQVRSWCVPVVGVALVVVGAGLAAAQQGGAGETMARVETGPLDPVSPEKFAVPAVTEPYRRVTVVTTLDGVIRSLPAQVGTVVRESQELALVDRVESAAHLKIAQAEVKQQQAAFDEVKQGDRFLAAQAEARLEASKARQELAQLQVDRCSLRAPFAGTVLGVGVSAGQYLSRGAAVLELADTSSLRALIPLDRASARPGAEVEVKVGGQVATGKVQATIPLPESFSALRDLATPPVAAWVLIPNTDGKLDAGQRAEGPFLPRLPVASVPTSAVRSGGTDGREGTIQILRNETVVDIQVQVLGSPTADITQISGPLRRSDTLIVGSSVALRPGTLVRFNRADADGTGAVVEGVAPNPDDRGESARILAPATAAGVAPIGAPGSAAPRAKAPSARPGPGARPAPAKAKGAVAVPF